MLTLSILGATGSIGLNTLEVASRHPDRYHVLALTAHKDVGRMAQLCREHRPEYAVMSDENSAKLLRERLASEGTHAQVLSGAAALADVASLPEVDTVMAGIVGAAGLLPTLAAVRAGKRVLLANKEPMVMAGGLFMREIARCKATLLPVDSEHNAIFQCMPPGYVCGGAPAGVRRVLLTASGGPFRDTALDKLDNVTPEQAVRHPNWVMGPKISVDSATMMNKGLELIEAAWLFGLEPERIDVMLHPQSVVHSLVEYEDSSMLAQMGQPDMRTPIACALAWPQRIGSGVPPLDLCAIGHLDFGPIDPVRYPCLTLARRALQAGGSYPAVLNAANEIAVEAFLNRQISYTGIAGVIEHCLDRTAGNTAANGGISDLDGILAVDAWARDEALKTLMGKRGRYAGV